MNGVRGIIMIVPAMALVLFQTEAPTQGRERSEIATDCKWKLEDLYPSDQAWGEAKQQLAGQLDEITQIR